MRDNFSKRTIERVAKRAGYLCSNPECRCPTVGAAAGHDGIVNVGVAAHITAAAPGGPRYDSSLTPEGRRDQWNAIWLCHTHSKLIDSDSEHFTIDLLVEWKKNAEKQSLESILKLGIAADQRTEPPTFDTEEHDLIERLGLPVNEDLESVTLRLIAAAQIDLAAFKRMPAWPNHAIPLNLRMFDGSSIRAFNASALAAAVETFDEIVVVAPPGTGKTITLLQVVDAIISQGNSIATFVPLGDWSSQSDSFFQSILRRQAFAGIREEYLRLLAHFGRLVLVFDGWNELDATSSKRAAAEIRSMEREFPGLGIILSTRRQALDAPISGPVVEIDALTPNQQQEIARALRGSQGEAILDHARRTAGVRELIAIPLYLTALLAHVTGATFPTTKDEVLRLFVREHEHAPDRAEALREAMFGFHTEMLTALGAEATRAANTTIPISRARAVIKQVEDRLIADGQISTAPQPTAILDVLISNHVLVRSGAETGGIAFQHQQFQEWYASFAVEKSMLVAATNDQGARRTLKTDLLNMPSWEEPILFACERLSRADEPGQQSVAASILETIGIDPMLAAEMIYRSSSGVWDAIKEKIITFVGKWHASGKVDRALGFMIRTGRSEFAAEIWTLIGHPDDQVHLAALRAAPRFRPSVLGAQVDVRMGELSESLRETILAEIARQSGMEGIELATKFAQADSSPTVKISVIESLLFRRADRFAVEILRTASDEVWRLLAQTRYGLEISDPDTAARLQRERQHYLTGDVQPLTKLHMLLDTAGDGTAVGPQIASVIEDPNFPVKNENARWIIEQAYKRYSNDVATALVRRLEDGREIPFGTERLLQTAGIAIDEGPLVDRVISANGYEKVGESAVSVLGPETVGSLIDTLMLLKEKLVDENTRKQYQRLRNWVSKTNFASFGRALLSRSAAVEPSAIALLADLLAIYGDREHEGPLQFNNELREQIIATVDRWAETILSSAAASRHQLADVARAIGRLAAPQLLPALNRLLSEDLSRWRRVREEYAAAHRPRTPIPSDVYTSWTLQYSRAFAAIGNREVVELMKTYLLDDDFGIEAASVLNDIWKKEQNSPKPKWPSFWADFSQVKARRLEREAQGALPESSEFAEAILGAVNDLVKADLGENAHRRAVQLAKIAFSMPYGDKAQLIDTLLQLTLLPAENQGLLTVLVLAGEIISADIILDGIKSLVEKAKINPWMMQEGGGEWEGWLELLPFSDRPEATLDALDLLEPRLRQPWRLRRQLLALGHAPSPVAEQVLGVLPHKDPRFISEQDWIDALVKRGTISAAQILLEQICGDAVIGNAISRDVRSALSNALASTIQAHAEFRGDVYQRYERMAGGPSKAILERAISDTADADGVSLLIRGYAMQGRNFDGFLRSAIEHIALGERPSASWVGAHEVFSVPVPELRKRLFGIINGDIHEGRLATACLAVIDELRDDYGSSEFEPRHPDIESGRPWPIEAGSIT